MIQLSQYCTYQGHEGNKVQFICLDDKCQQKRLFCSKCALNNHQRHENTDNIKDLKELKTFIQKEIEQQMQLLNKNDMFVQRSIDVIKKIQFQMQKILDILQEIQTKPFIQNKIQSLQNQLDTIKRTKLTQVDDQFISQLLNMDLKQNRQFMINELKEECDILMNNSIELQQMSQQEVQIEKLKNIEYEITQCEQLRDEDIYSASTISSDSKFMVQNSENKYMKIWNNLNQNLIKEYNQNDYVHISKFTEDSMLLYTGTDQGLLCCYDAQNGFQQTYKQKIHFHSILNLYCIDNHLVLTSSFDKRIIKTNTLLKQQLLVIQAHDDRIDGLDYNRSKDVIASCSKDNFIKLWDNKKGQLLVSKSLVNQSIISQVLFINNSDHLVSLDSKPNINIWKIRYQSKELQLVKQIGDINLMFGISLVLNQSLILCICQEQIRFYTIQGEYVHQIKHDIKEFFMQRGVQLDSMNSIIIQGKNQIKILKAKK